MPENEDTTSPPGPRPAPFGAEPDETAAQPPAGGGPSGGDAGGGSVPVEDNNAVPVEEASVPVEDNNALPPPPPISAED